MRILDSTWFTNRDGCTGIVAVEDEYDGVKYYIGHVRGLDEKQDAQHVAEWGSTFPTDAGKALFANRW